MTSRMLSLCLCASLGMSGGCAASSPSTATRTSDRAAMQTASSRHATDRVYYWREEARELHEMADRREREADLLSRSEQGTAAQDVVARMRSLAKQLRASAEYADEQAQEAQRQAPQEMAR